MLDVQMPGLTGFEVARRLVEAGSETQLVFVTAFDRHAIQAFEINAVDYLLKPVEAERLTIAVDRVRRRLAPNGAPAKPADRRSGTAPAAAGGAPGPPRAAGHENRRPVPAGPGR